jgi:hypothetical protein
MAKRLRYNPPPNWPPPPEGLAPQPGWQPDPAWGPAPKGWKLWVDERPWLARHKLLTALGGIVVLIIIASVASSGGRNQPSTASSSAGTTASEQTSAAPLSATHSSQPSTSASLKAKTRDNSSAKLTTLGAGSFTVGADLPPGRYVITPGAGQSGNLSASSSDDPVAINEILGDAGGLGVPSVTSNLAKGEVVKISGLSQVTFTPADTKLLTSLTTGDWEVGLDIAAGRYVAAPTQGGSGNFVVYDKHGLPKTNEVLGDAGGLGVPNVTVSLDAGDRIHISGLAEVIFTAK